ncbi:unnamed protein product [Miscanthus lutarioriparius]|uniref:glutathione transferase n=1 Tax=Miscanthus lutarioriparius TaxID=422564 RepID=A0A811RS65_9POAL|nr:unnamed protein product [Miscanthus lutarioriparius]
MVDMWVEVEAHQMQPLAGAIAVECIVAPVLHGRERNQAVIDENVEKLKKVLEVYEARLAQSSAWWKGLAARPAAKKVAEFMPLGAGAPKKQE